MLKINHTNTTNLKILYFDTYREKKKTMLEYDEAEENGINLHRRKPLFNGSVTALYLQWQTWKYS